MDGAETQSEEWSFGGVTVTGRVVLGPMAGVTDLPFRLLAWEQGIGLAYTEMVSGAAMVYRNPRTWDLLQRDPAEGPVSLQLFGRDPAILATAVALALEHCRTGEDGGGGRPPAAIDLNAGCPTPKIVRNGEGSALLREPELLGEIVQALVSVARPQGIPVTVKIRTGWDGANLNAVEAAKAAEAAGAALVAVHGRTREQLYHGRADWSMIKRVKEAVKIPVIGNGDVTSPAEALRLRSETGCDAVMIARGALGNPWLLGQAAAALAGRSLPPLPSTEERIAVLLRHLRLQVAHFGERHGVLEMRKHVAWYLKGLPDSAQVRKAAQAATTARELVGMLEAYAAAQPARAE